jgi:quercetin dioxygenase-like cupin family protein
MADVTRVRFADLPNHLADEGGEFRMAREALGSDQLGVTSIRLPPGGSTQGDQGHFHDVQDEAYVLVHGGPVEVQADDDRLELHAGEVLRVAPHVVRAFRNRGDEDAVLIAVSGRQPPEGDDSHPVDDFWTEDADER